MNRILNKLTLLTLFVTLSTPSLFAEGTEADERANAMKKLMQMFGGGKKKKTEKEPEKPAVEEEKAKAEMDQQRAQQNEMAQKMMQQMMSGQGMQNLIRMQMEKDFQKKWYDFIVTLDKEKAKTFKETMLESQSRSTDKAMAMLGRGSMTPNKQETNSLMKEQYELEKKIETVLGAKDFAAYMKYKSKMDATSKMGSIEFQLRQKFLGQKKRDQVIAIFAEMDGALQNSELAREMKKNPSVEHMQANMEKFMSATIEADKKSLAKASGILSAEEAKLLSEGLEKHQQMMQVGMKMAPAMLGDQQEEK